MHHHLNPSRSWQHPLLFLPAVEGRRADHELHLQDWDQTRWSLIFNGLCDFTML